MKKNHQKLRQLSAFITMYVVNFTLSVVASCCLVLCVASPHFLQAPSIVFQYSNATPKAWIEYLAQRRNGDVLMLRFDVPELWSLDPARGSASLIHTFPKYNDSVTGLSSIIEYEPDDSSEFDTGPVRRASKCRGRLVNVPVADVR